MKLIVYFLLFLLMSCASYQSGHTAKIEKDGKILENTQDIKVTAFQDDEYSTEYFTFIQVEFGNNTDEWKDVNKVLLNVVGDDVKIILGQRLSDWSQAINNKVKVDRYNEQMVLETIVTSTAIGAIGSSHNGNIQSTNTYATILAGVAITDQVNNLTNKVSDLERTKIFPKGHLYSPFSLPPGLVSKRWILVQHAKNVQVVEISFDVYFKNSKKQTYVIDITKL